MWLLLSPVRCYSNTIYRPTAFTYIRQYAVTRIACLTFIRLWPQAALEKTSNNNTTTTTTTTICLVVLYSGWPGWAGTRKTFTHSQPIFVVIIAYNILITFLYLLYGPQHFRCLIIERHIQRRRKRDTDYSSWSDWSLMLTSNRTSTKHSLTFRVRRLRLCTVYIRLCYHRNEIDADIRKLFQGAYAQLYRYPRPKHSPRLHWNTCNSVEIHHRTDTLQTHTDRHTPVTTMHFALAMSNAKIANAKCNENVKSSGVKTQFVSWRPRLISEGLNGRSVTGMQAAVCAPPAPSLLLWTSHSVRQG